MTSKRQKRVILWAPPRSMSTAVFRAISNAPNTHCIFEPYIQSYYFGEERQSDRYAHLNPKTDLTYRDIRSTLEQDYSSSEVVFVKDMSYGIMNYPGDLTDVLPKGYIHTFLIRHPRKSISSLHRTSIKVKDDGWGYFDANEAGFRDLWHLYRFVTETLKQDTVIIDADDILTNPERVLQQYCGFTGIKYHPAMITWSEENFQRHDMIDTNSTLWFNTVCNSKTFLQSDRSPEPTAADLRDVEPELGRAINENMPYYMKLYDKRLAM